MPRVKRGRAHIKHRRNLLKKTKGYRWGRSKRVKQAKEAILHAGLHARRDRRGKKRTARKLWQVQINAAVRQHNLSYSRFIDLLKKNKVDVDRKILAQLARNEQAFADLVSQLK